MNLYDELVYLFKEIESTRIDVNVYSRTLDPKFLNKIDPGFDLKRFCEKHTIEIQPSEVQQ